jgi:hypothetical protein
LIYFNESNPLVTKLLVSELGVNLNTRRAIFLVSRTLGHGGPSTFLYHYSHEHENLIGRLYQRNDNVIRRSKFYSVICGIPDATIRKHLSRKKEGGGDINLFNSSKILEMFWKRSLKNLEK